MAKQALVVGGGIGGLSAGLACARAGWEVRLFERAAHFSEVGAGIQIGPNVTRVLHAWGLADGLRGVAAFPPHLAVRSATTGRELGALRLGGVAVQRYGAPYATILRADMQRLLLEAVQRYDSVRIDTGFEVSGFSQDLRQVWLDKEHQARITGDLLIGADGLWSRVRQCLLDDGLPRVTGHLAYRALVPQSSLPVHLRSQHITVWLGPDLHLVQYPVRCGEWLNLVGIVHGAAMAGKPAASGGWVDDWDHGTDAATLRATLAGSCTPLRELAQAIEHWRMWILCDRPPMSGPQQHYNGRVALLGDAAHPMRPYLAQGAGMAIEDAAELGRVLAAGDADVPEALRRYAGQRWQRNRRVQLRAIRNGRIFHLHGLAAAGRDAALSVLGERLLDVPWLYGG